MVLQSHHITPEASVMTLDYPLPSLENIVMKLTKVEAIMLLDKTGLRGLSVTPTLLVEVMVVRGLPAVVAVRVRKYLLLGLPHLGQEIILILLSQTVRPRQVECGAVMLTPVSGADFNEAFHLRPIGQDEVSGDN